MEILSKVVGSIPTVAGHIFQARLVWIYTQSNITNILSNNLVARPNHEFSAFEKKYRRKLNVSRQPMKQCLVFSKY